MKAKLAVGRSSLDPTVEVYIAEDGRPVGPLGVAKQEGSKDDATVLSSPTSGAAFGPLATPTWQQHQQRQRSNGLTRRWHLPNGMLGPLADNGGPTWTHTLLTESSAINAADPATAPDVDQRGVARPHGCRPQSRGALTCVQ